MNWSSAKLDQRWSWSFNRYEPIQLFDAWGKNNYDGSIYSVDYSLICSTKCNIRRNGKKVHLLQNILFIEKMIEFLMMSIKIVTLYKYTKIFFSFRLLHLEKFFFLIYLFSLHLFFHNDYFLYLKIY